MIRSSLKLQWFLASIWVWVWVRATCSPDVCGILDAHAHLFSLSLLVLVHDKALEDVRFSARGELWAFSDFSSGRVAQGLILSRGRRNGPRAETLTMSACSLVIHGHWARASICVRYKYKVNVLHARWRQAVKEAVRSIKTNNGLTAKSWCRYNIHDSV